jgi:hypothetical protein
MDENNICTQFRLPEWKWVTAGNLDAAITRRAWADLEQIKTTDWLTQTTVSFEQHTFLGRWNSTRRHKSQMCMGQCWAGPARQHIETINAEQDHFRGRMRVAAGRTDECMGLACSGTIVVLRVCVCCSFSLVLHWDTRGFASASAHACMRACTLLPPYCAAAAAVVALLQRDR